MKTLPSKLNEALQIGKEDSKKLEQKIKEITKAFRRSEDEYDDFANYFIEDVEGVVADLDDEQQREYDEAIEEIWDYRKQIPKIQKNILSILQKLTKITDSNELRSKIEDAIEQIDTILSEDIDGEITTRIVTLLQIFKPDDYLVDGTINCGFCQTVGGLLDWLEDFRDSIYK